MLSLQWKKWASLRSSSKGENIASINISEIRIFARNKYSNKVNFGAV